ncbi:DEAD/DEAH box helicase family protein [Clostridium estertheticum]|uniref:DEAD/DEAH box helicase family protein n=1 Tax=Clostridium estertheticum TaxID=238834 RepID=UPI001C0E3F0D|nr:DEAD/DEAH box helicase family protein [Clostridium estertheticum]MBU3176663.1 DEAD/DEAH box helicase family protein [Clostridium estertheticum]
MKNKGYEIYNCNDESLERQKEYLQNEIINGDSRNYFKVIDLECGTGKTMETERAMAHMAMTTGKKALFVRERKEDCISSAKRINEIAGVFGDTTVAIAINRDTHTQEHFEEIKNQLKQYPIIVITHEKYKALSISKNKRYFEKEREVLVVDEFLDFINQLSIDMEMIYKFGNLLGSRELTKQYEECINELKDYLTINEGKHSFFNAESDILTIGKGIDKLVKMVKNSITVAYASTTIYETKNNICYKILELKQFYNQTCLVEGNIIYCTDKRPQYWLLDNNIILDAGARLNGAYKLNKELFHVQHQTPVLEHSEWFFSCLKINSSKGSKEKAINYYDVVNKVIEESNSEETLVIGNKIDEERICAINKNHFGNINGSNKYRHLRNVIITHNPNVPFRVYILEYLYYSNQKLDNRSKWTGKNVGKGIDKVFRFADSRFEDYRQYKNANEIYQAIKRVNRNMERESMVIIFNNDTETIDRVIKMFKNCIVTTKEDCGIVEYKETKKDKDTLHRRENRQARRFIKMCQEMLEFERHDLLQRKKNRKGEYDVVKGVYSKQKIREFLGIADKNNFKTKVMNDLDVIDFCGRHNIKGLDSGQTLDFNV